ncbi:hypothetical protein RSAG8_05457, partial [Rhizoctonia solani AG-8 WAC10335]
MEEHSGRGTKLSRLILSFDLYFCRSANPLMYRFCHYTMYALSSLVNLWVNNKRLYPHWDKYMEH